MNQFMQRHASSILGELHGFDRVRFRGTPRFVANADGLGIFLHRMGVKLKDFKGYAMGVTERLKSASLAVAQACRRPVHYLPSATQSKEDLARQIAAADRVREGLVCVLTCVEPCMAFEIRKNQQGLLQLRSCLRKCLHVYHYHRHPVLGWMHARLQRANDRYFQALSAEETSQPLHRLVGRLCRPAQDHKGRRVRALNPLAGDDAVLLEAIGRGEFLINGLRNRDLRAVLHPDDSLNPLAVKRRSAAISRKLRMLIAHGLLQKIQHTHRYQVTAEGRRILAALAAARAADVQKLAKAA